MHTLRFNIGNLLAIIFVLGVGFAALRESTDIWESGIFTVALGVMLISTILAVHRTETRRAYWIGFAIFGWVYLALSLVPPIESRLITTKALAYVDSKVPRPSQVISATINFGTGSGTGNKPAGKISFGLDDTQIAGEARVMLGIRDAATGEVQSVPGKLFAGWGGTTANFVRIGHSLFALLAGWLGGQLSRRLQRSSRSPV